MEKHSILTLLPYAANSQLINKQQKLGDLHLTKSLLAFSITALETFLKGNLAEFDAQIGENLCQIRAYKILVLAKKWLYSDASKLALQQHIDELKNYHNQLLTTINDWEQAIKNANSFNRSLDSIENIIVSFERHQLNFELNEDMLFIIMCHFLTHFNIKEKQIPVAIDGYVPVH